MRQSTDRVAPRGATGRRRAAGQRGAALRLVALLSGLVLVVAGCASLPGTSAPRVVDEYAPSDPATSVPAPVDNQEPDLLVRDFLKASAIANQRHLAARQFLTEDAAQNWDSTESTTIVQRADIAGVGERTENRVSYTIRGEADGSLDSGGIYQVEDKVVEAQLDLVRVDGQWRIDSLPDGVIFERTDFFSNYARRSLFFLSPDGTSVVPDPRWTSSFSQDLAYSLVNLLGDGPRFDLQAAVRSQIPETVTARPPEDGRNGPGITIDFQGLPALGTQETREFAAQIVWTLDSAEIPGPYRLEREGTPIDDRYADGWVTADLEEFAPYHSTEPMTLAVTGADGVMEVSPDSTTLTDSGWSDVRSGRSGALSRDGSELGVVTESDVASEATLLVGPRDGGPRPVFAAGTLTRPTWSQSNDVVWTVADGREIVRVDVSGEEPVATRLDAEAMGLPPEPITDFRIAPSGVRAVFTAGGRVYITSLVDDGEEISVGPATVIGQALGPTIRTVDWLDSATVVVGRDAQEAPVMTISMDGADQEPLSGRNISYPVDSIAVAGTEVYVVDSRSLLRLETTAELGERYWRDLPGLASIRAQPITKG